MFTTQFHTHIIPNITTNFDQNLKRVALELGGNCPFVVLSDADVNQAVNAAIFGKFIHQGQICMIVNRMIVHQDKYDEFVEKFVARAKELPMEIQVILTQ